MARIAFAGREVWPFVQGGGLGRFIWLAATWLAPQHEVTIVTSDAHRPEYERMRATGEERLPAGVTFHFAPEPEGDVRPFHGYGHAWSANLAEAVAELAPDVAEFADYAGEGFAAVHARRGGDPRLAATAVVVRAHTSAEIIYALDDQPPRPENGVLWALERFPLRHADALLGPAGDVLERYGAFYGRVAPGVCTPMPVEIGPDDGRAPAADGPLRLLYLGRLQPIKGIAALAEAVLSLPDADLRLTVVGGDTDHAPGGGSMRAHVARMVAGDPRIEFREAVPHGDLPQLFAAHDAVVLPSRWEAFSYVVREALSANRPVLATPVGAVPEVVVAGRSGWLAESPRPEHLAAALSEIDADAARALIAARGPRETLEASLPSPEELAAPYAALARAARRRAVRAPQRVAAVVAVLAGDAPVEGTLRSLAAQRGVQVAVTLVAAPATLPAGVLLDVERTVLAEGAGDRLAAWSAGLAVAQEELVMLVPAGAELEPEFARRGAEALAQDAAFAYATANAARGRHGWHAPLGGEDLAAAGADSGASVAIARREVLEGALAAAGSERALWTGLAGVVMQEPLVRRLPRRAASEGAPAHAGAPPPEAVRAAFAGFVSSA